MATIQSQFRISDAMTPVLRNITTAMNMCITSFEEMQAASGQAMNLNNLASARAEIDAATRAFDDMENNLRKVERQQNMVNSSINAGTGFANNMLTSVMGIASAMGASAGVNKLIGLSDEMTGLTARLSFIVDDGGSVADLEAKIFASAERSRASYQTTANVIAQLGMQAGDSFSSNDELLAFSEQLNKTFVIAGTSGQAVDSVMYNLTQALSSGVLRGQDLNSVMSNAMPIVQNIARYLGVSVGEIRDMAASGALSASVVKNAMLAASEETNAAFEAMPRTWQQIWTSMSNQAITALDPVLKEISAMANDPRMPALINGVTGGIKALASVAVPVLSGIFGLVSAVTENWGWLSPIIMGVVSSMLLLQGVQMAYNTVQAISNGLSIASAAYTAIKSGASLAEAAATTTATGAQVGFNAALLACPITWIVLIIIGVVAAFYAMIGAMNKASDTSVSATGMILGAFAVVGAVLWNLFLGFFELVLGVIDAFVNPFINFANFIANVFNNPVSSVIYMFQDLGDQVLGVLENIATALDFVLGTDMAGTIAGWREDLQDFADDLVKEYAPEENYEDLVRKLNLSVEETGLNRWDYNDAFDSGYAVGEEIEQRISSMFGNNPAAGIGDEYSGLLNDIDTNTGSTAASLKNMSEDLVYMRDVAEREAINRFTTAEIRVDMTGMTNRIDNTNDIDGVIGHLVEKVSEALTSAAEGVHK